MAPSKVSAQLALEIPQQEVKIGTFLQNSETLFVPHYQLRDNAGVNAYMLPSPNGWEVAPPSKASPAFLLLPSIELEEEKKGSILFLLCVDRKRTI